jgi:hypothetical protein
MFADSYLEKITPATAVTAALDGLEAGLSEVLVDDTAKFVKSSVSLVPTERYAESVS